MNKIESENAGAGIPTHLEEENGNIASWRPTLHLQYPDHSSTFQIPNLGILSTKSYYQKMAADSDQRVTADEEIAKVKQENRTLEDRL